MTKKNPKASVQGEQFVAKESADEHTDEIKTELPAEQADEQPPETVAPKKTRKREKVAKKVDLNAEIKLADEIHQVAPAPEDNHSLDEIELPQVDYSGYSKNELVE